jgi:S1-C subfamily serine protease
MPSAVVSKMCAALFVVAIFFIPVTTAQQPPAVNPPPAANPAPPNPAPPKEEPDIELNSVLMESTFMIQGQSAQGPTIGTMFMIGRPIPNTTPVKARYVMVTAAHVLEQMQGDAVVLHLRKKVDEKTNSWIHTPVPLQIRANGQPLWIRHPDVDVAVMYISIPSDNAITLLPTNNLADDKMLTEYEVKPGDELRCLGYPLGTSSNDAGFPILRSGRIASYPLLPTDKTKTFLLDLRVFKGNSGGPVYFVERMRPNPKQLGSYMSFHFLVGLVSEEIIFAEQSGGPYSQEFRQTQLGLAKVVHASLIKQTIEMLPPPQPDLQTSPDSRPNH